MQNDFRKRTGFTVVSQEGLKAVGVVVTLAGIVAGLVHNVQVGYSITAAGGVMTLGSTLNTVSMKPFSHLCHHQLWQREQSLHHEWRLSESM